MFLLLNPFLNNKILISIRRELASNNCNEVNTQNRIFAHLVQIHQFWKLKVMVLRSAVQFVFCIFASIRTCQDIQCLHYAGVFNKFPIWYSFLNCCSYIWSPHTPLPSCQNQQERVQCPWQCSSGRFLFVPGTNWLPSELCGDCERPVQSCTKEIIVHLRADSLQTTYVSTLSSFWVLNTCKTKKIYNLSSLVITEYPPLRAPLLKKT